MKVTSLHGNLKEAMEMSSCPENYLPNIIQFTLQVNSFQANQKDQREMR